MHTNRYTVKVGVAREAEEEFQTFIEGIGIAETSNEPSSAAGGLEITIFDLTLQSQFIWGIVLGYLISRNKYFEILLKGGMRLQPTKEDVKELEKVVLQKERTKSLPKKKSTKKG